jgi:hypothetical protein
MELFWRDGWVGLVTEKAAIMTSQNNCIAADLKKIGADSLFL